MKKDVLLDCKLWAQPVDFPFVQFITTFTSRVRMFVLHAELQSRGITAGDKQIRESKWARDSSWLFLHIATQQRVQERFPGERTGTSTHAHTHRFLTPSPLTRRTKLFHSTRRCFHFRLQASLTGSQFPVQPQLPVSGVIVELNIPHLAQDLETPSGHWGDYNQIFSTGIVEIIIRYVLLIYKCVVNSSLMKNRSLLWNLKERSAAALKGQWMMWVRATLC